MGENKELKKTAYLLLSLREKFNLTQDEVARKTGISRSTLAGYEAGARNPKYEALRKLADLYGVTVEYLLKGNEDLDEQAEENTDKLILFNAIKGMDDNEARQARAIIEALIRTSKGYVDE